MSPRLKTYPNGASAMHELAQAKGARLLGCPQVTEIKNTPGLEGRIRTRAGVNRGITAPLDVAEDDAQPSKNGRASIWNDQAAMLVAASGSFNFKPSRASSARMSSGESRSTR